MGRLWEAADTSDLTLHVPRQSSHPAADLTEWDGCGRPPTPLPTVADRWVFLNQSKSANCSIDERVASLQVRTLRRDVRYG